MTRLIAVKMQSYKQAHAVYAASEEGKPVGKIRMRIKLGNDILGMEPLCLMSFYDEWGCSFVKSSDDYEIYSMDGSTDKVFMGVDFVTLDETANSDVCSSCSHVARIVTESNLPSEVFSVLRTKNVRLSEWSKYADYPAEWVEAVLTSGAEVL